MTALLPAAANPRERIRLTGPTAAALFDTTGMRQVDIIGPFP